MFGLLRSLACLRGQHERDMGKVHFRGDRLISECVGCGRPMEKGVRGWRLER